MSLRIFKFAYWCSIVDRVKDLIKYKGYQGMTQIPKRANPQSRPRNSKRFSLPIH